MTDFLVLLAKLNLAMAGATLIVALLRRPMRAAFHAPLAYALWLLVPAAMLASLLPPRMIAAAAPTAVLPIPFSVSAALPARLLAGAPSFDGSLVLFALWLAGAGAMALSMARAQRQFHRAERRGAAGPAVTGILKPRIVLPAGFAAQFSAAEQAAILAHEAAHLARQDARVNALVALLRALCWFNPLAHLGAVWLRRDQELACDASALKRVKRVDYANALLKSQRLVVALPLGCAWPGAEHPLTERVALLKRPPPAPLRQFLGAALIVSLTACAGIGAWAAQPATVVGKSFKGKFFYAQNAGDGGPPLLLTLEFDMRDKFSGGKGKFDAGEQQPHLVMHFPDGMAQADSGHLDFGMDPNLAEPKTITLSGNVRLMTSLTGLGELHGETLVFDARTGMLDLDGRNIPSGMPKYVPCTKDCPGEMKN